MQNLEKFSKTSLNSSKTRAENDSFWMFYKNMCISELDQKEKFAFQIVNQILYSKRLLVDHVESLELSLPYLAPVQTTEHFTLRNASIIVISSIIHKIVTPRNFQFTLLPVSLFAGGFCSLYVAKKINDVRLKYIERQLGKLIQALDVFGNCIKRNIMYFNEILVMKPKELIESRQIERAWDCITSVKEVIDILYDATRKLEEKYKLSAKYHEFYFPMEELRESDYFNKNVTDFTPKNIKDFYNIYSYVQSQFLLRLALTVCQYNKIPFVLEDVPEIQRLIQQHINEEDEHFVNLSLQLRAKQQFEISNIHKQQTCLSKSGPIAVLKESSMKLSSCIIAVAEECQKLDLSLQKVDEFKFNENSNENINDEGNCLLDIANSMRTIEESLELCCNDFHRLMIVYNKFLNTNIEAIEISSNDSDLDKEILALENNSNSDFIKSLQEIENDKKDDFFAYVQDSEEVKSEKLNEQKDNDFELINLDEKITKGKFKPVLKQLKLKIDPIKKNMLEKEKRVLESKGIDIKKLIEINVDILNDEDEIKTQDLKSGIEDSDSEGSADELDKLIQRSKKDNYEDMRNFLAQKDAINLFETDSIPLKRHVAEDILE